MSETEQGASGKGDAMMHVLEEGLAVGTKVTFAKTVSEADIYLFAGISGDFHPNHVNEEYMKTTRYGRRVAHGALLVAFMSTCSTKMAERVPDAVTVSYGYDRIRFIAPVFLGDTTTVEYVIQEHLPAENKILANITVRNQEGTIVAVASHILKVL